LSRNYSHPFNFPQISLISPIPKPFHPPLSLLYLPILQLSPQNTRSIANGRQMLSTLSFARTAARTLPRPMIDLRQLLNVGATALLKKRITKLQTVNRTALPGDEVLSTNRLMDQIERLTAGMIEANIDKNHQSAGSYIDVKHRRPAYLGQECTFKAEVVEVTPTKAKFKVEVQDSLTGEVLGMAEHSRVIIYCGEGIKT
jgi:predicted thioesterase